MNGNPRNRNVAPPKQINRIAAPIQVTPNQNQTPNQQVPQQVNTGIQNPGVNPQVMRVNTGVQNPQIAPQAQVSALAQAAQNQSIRGNNAKKKAFVKLEHDPSTMIFITILLIILAVLCAFVFYIILPRIEANKKERLDFNDGTTTTVAPVVNRVEIKSLNINNGNAITSAGNYTVDNTFTVTTTSNLNGGIDISINNNNVTSTKKIFGTVGRIDEIIIMALADGDVRNNRLVIYDKNGALIKEVKNFEGADGMLLTNERNGYNFSGNSIIVLASRVKDNKIILSNEPGVVDGIDICDKNLLASKNISDSFMVIGSYSITYKGNNEFSDPFSVNNVTLLEYRDSNNFCR